MAAKILIKFISSVFGKKLPLFDLQMQYVRRVLYLMLLYLYR